MAEVIVTCSCGTANKVYETSQAGFFRCGKCCKPLIGNGLNVPDNCKCIICHKGECRENMLINRVTYHTSCYKELEKKLCDLETDILEFNKNIRVLNLKINKANSVWSGLVSFIRGKEIDTSAFQDSIDKCKMQIEKTKKETLFARATLEYCHDYWPSYPPDWKDRVSLVRKRDFCCDTCSSHRNLDVHHRVRIANGGNHLISNLELLCRHCHEKRHKVKEFSNTSQNGPSKYSQRLNIIRTAIADGQKIHFRYRKFDDDRSTRTISPEGLERIGKSLCVKGWCDLRDAERVFAIQRMRAVKIVLE